jgi:ABC-type nickel/cobalt efflux system permease component RcnA
MFPVDRPRRCGLANQSSMQFAALTTLAATGFSVAFFHAAIPTHWLPFVLVARERGWARGKTMAVALLAGLGHVALTFVLGLGIAWFGFQVEEKVEAFPWIAGGMLAAFALYYGWRQLRGRGICHHNPPGSQHHASEHCHEEKEVSHWQEELKGSALVSQRTGEWTAIGGLFVMLTLSPCEASLGIYLSAVQFGWRGFFVLSAILAVATLAGMLLFTWLALLGFDRVRLKRFERFEAGLLAAVFAVLAVLVLLIEHGHEH